MLLHNSIRMLLLSTSLWTGNRVCCLNNWICSVETTLVSLVCNKSVYMCTLDVPSYEISSYSMNSPIAMNLSHDIKHTSIYHACNHSVAIFRYWWIRIKALAEAREWPELEKFSKSKKSPIGYEVTTECS